MTLMELQNILGKRIEVAMKDGLTPEERAIENEKSALIISAAKQMINNGDLILRTEKLQAQCRGLKNSYAMKLVTG